MNIEKRDLLIFIEGFSYTILQKISNIIRIPFRLIYKNTKAVGIKRTNIRFIVYEFPILINTW